MNQITIIDPRDADRAGFKYRLQGKDIRDCVLILKTDATPDIGMVVREPVSNTIVEHVVKGDNIALNIDCSRVGTPFMSSGGNNFDAWRSGEGRKDRPLKHGSPSQKIQEGRFPANLILMHEPECVYSGKKKVKAISSSYTRTERADSNVYGGGCGIKEKGYQTTGYASEDGTETVDNWECSPTCPVGLLDAQSGVLHSRGNITPTKRNQSNGVTGWGISSVPMEVRLELNQSGGASRFFKQVSSQEELDRYFRDLLDKIP